MVAHVSLIGKKLYRQVARSGQTLCIADSCDCLGAIVRDHDVRSDSRTGPMLDQLNLLDNYVDIAEEGRAEDSVRCSCSHQVLNQRQCTAPSPKKRCVGHKAHINCERQRNTRQALAHCADFSVMVDRQSPFFKPEWLLFRLVYKFESLVGAALLDRCSDLVLSVGQNPKLAQEPSTRKHASFRRQ